MCGIVGYVGRRPGKPIILDGLRRLEYRGYDSAGIALIEAGGIETVRAVGNLDALFAAAGENGSEARVGLGHTRWATHGRPSEENAHPHTDCSGRVSIVVNGIVENYKELRASSPSAATCSRSETDAEVVVAPDRGAHRRRADRGGPRRRRLAPGALRLLRDLRRRARHRGRDPQRVPAGRRRRRGRDVLRLRDPRVPGAHEQGRRARGRRRRHAPRRRRGVLRRRRSARCSRRDGRPVGRRRRGEGRLRDLHAQGDPRAAGGPAPTRSPAACGRTASSTSRRSGWTTRCCAACGASSSSPAARPTTPG